MSRSCVICGGNLRRRLTGLYDDRYGYPGRFDLDECESCGHRQLDAHFSDAELSELYSRYYPRRSMTGTEFVPHREAGGLRAWLEGARSAAFRWVPRNVCVLDIGSGVGQALAYHRARGCDAWGVEADENTRLAAERHGLNLRIGTFDPAMFAPGKFDYVTMDQVIEHARDPVAFMRGAASLLRAGGHAILSTPNSRGCGVALFGARWINWHVPYHLQQFSRPSLDVLARKAGLEIASLRTLTNSAWLHFQWLHLGCVPAPGSASPFWDPERAERDMPRSTKRVADLLHALKLDQLATRAADALRIGDNFLCVMRKPS